VILWTIYPRTANLLAKALKKYKPLVVHGEESTSVKKEDRAKVVDAWKKDPEQKLAIFSYVLATSINITEVNRQLYFDNTLDSDPRDQSLGRTRRATSKEPTITVYLLYDKSIDIYVYFNILEAKSTVKRTLNARGEVSLDLFKKVFNAKALDYQDKELQLAVK